MKTRNRTILFAGAALILLALMVWFLLHGAVHDWSVTVNGERVTGLPGLGYTLGGILLGLSAALLALVLVSLILSGVSLLVVALLAIVFLGVLMLLAPLLVPVLLLAGLFLLIKRNRQRN